MVLLVIAVMVAAAIAADHGAAGGAAGAAGRARYQALGEHVDRFSPVRTGKDDLPRFHGTSERTGIDNDLEAVRLYVQLAKNSAAGC